MKLYQKSELKDSRIFFDKKPPMFLTMFILFILFMIIFAIWMSSWMSKSYIVEANGTITTTDNIYISALSDGVLTSLNSQEGTFVKRVISYLKYQVGVKGYNTVLYKNKYQIQRIRYQLLINISIH